ncbi:NAD(P)/FAD-dependent oxidoreductase [Streptomyces sp. NPDC088923]|uniref:NAD(P)/FAD-dependent oxidoreductase n=1 Tax=Streptomyces sp. NPDC088923 TaxID=3365913 RepID=UPI0038020684
MRILVIGGGHAGTYTALRLERLLHAAGAPRAEVRLVTPEPSLTYRPLLAAAAAGTLSPRHVLVPLRRVLRTTRLLLGEAVSLDLATRTAYVRTPAGPEAAPVPYDVLVLTPGTAPTPPPPHALTLHSIADALALRSHVLAQLDLASSTRDPAVREAALCFVFLGGGYAGVDALPALRAMAERALRHYPGLRPADLRWVLAEPGERLLPEAPADSGTYVARALRRDGTEIRLGAAPRTYRPGLLVLDDGDSLATRTLVHTPSAIRAPGAPPHPLLTTPALPLTPDGRLRCTSGLAVTGTPHTWAAGDTAAVPDPQRPGATRAPHAGHAHGQAQVLADNLLATLRGEPTRPYDEKDEGLYVALGPHDGLARLHGRTFTGRPAVLLARAHHLSRLPTARRKGRVLTEWAFSALFPREPVPLGAPAAGPGEPP